MASVKITFYLKDLKKQDVQEGTAPAMQTFMLMCRVTHGGDRLFFSPNIERLKASQWNHDKQRVQKYQLQTEINGRLDTLTGQLKKWQMEAEALVQPVLPYIKDKIKPVKQQAANFFAEYQRFVKSIASGRKEGTLKVYQTVYNNLEAFQQAAGVHITFDSVKEFMQDDIQEHQEKKEKGESENEGLSAKEAAYLFHALDTAFNLNKSGTEIDPAKFIASIVGVSVRNVTRELQNIKDPKLKKDNRYHKVIKDKLKDIAKKLNNRKIDEAIDKHI